MVMFSSKIRLSLVWVAILILIIVDQQRACCSDPDISKYTITRRDKFFSLFLSDEQKGWVVGNNGCVLKTIDGGNNWTKLNIQTNHALNNIRFIDAQGWIVGGGGTIMHSIDGGESWLPQKSGTQNTLLTSYFIDTDIGFATGELGIILSTKNGGKSWEDISFDWMSLLPKTAIEKGILSPNLYSICFVDKSHGWIVGENGTVVYTADAGNSWELRSVEKYPSLYSVYFKNLMEGLAVGQAGTLIRTIDGGTTWDRIQMPASMENIGFYQIAMKGSIGIVAGDMGVVLKSSDGGTTWNRIDFEMPYPPPWFMDVAIASHNSPVKFLIIGQGVIMKSQVSK